MRDGLPIGLGYLAVSFSLGIAARNAGLNATEGFFASLFNIASAGEYALFTLIAAQAGYIETAIMTLVVNARYLLMSCAMSQRFSPDASIADRVGVGALITDELFGIAIARPGYINPRYTYGAALTSVIPWAVGTSLGILAGNLLPPLVVSSLSVAIYGMFLAIIVPPARSNKTVAVFILIAFAASFAGEIIPLLSQLSSGTRTILITVVLASAAALIAPVKEDGDAAEAAPAKKGEPAEKEGEAR